MNKSDVNSPKYISKQLKLSGLQKLKFYCQICQKQCRDANGFKSHTRSQPHIEKIQSISVKDIDNFSKMFQAQFLNTLRTSHKNYINANRFYNELISDKDHIHLNSTRWTSLSQFIKDMNSKGLINIRKGDEDDENESLNNLDIIANGNDEQLKRVDNDDENVDLATKLIERQIKRDKELSRQKEKTDEKEVPAEDATETEKKPVKFQIGEPTSKESSKTNRFKISKHKQLKASPLKTNVFKAKSKN